MQRLAPQASSGRGPDCDPIPWDAIEALLHRVQKPGRYVGGEVNAVATPWDEADVHVCLAFPDLYELGMSNFALTLLYDQLNRRPGVLAHRAYLPAPDMIDALRGAGLPLYSLEAYRPLRAYDLLGLSTAYEQLYTNVLEVLDLAGLPLHSAARDASAPLVIAGGHGTFNPEPITDFIDAFVIGEGELIVLEIVEALREVRGLPREAQLRRLLSIEGLYVPRFYAPRYHPAGGLAALTPLDPAAPPRIPKRLMPTLPPTPLDPVIPNIETVHNRAVIEIHRGCTRGCRFCQAGTITRPIRERPVEEIVATAQALIERTGYEELALLSLSSADYSEIETLLARLLAAFEGRRVSLSLPSLRIDSFSVDLADSLSRGRRSGFTFAPEAGSEALRHRINKDISDAELFAVAEEVFRRGWRTLKLYFMIGLPGETEEDIEALIALVQQVRAIGRRIAGRKAEIHVGVSTFVPKPHTPFQWEPLAPEAVIERRQARLREGLRGGGIRLSWNPYSSTWVEALLAVGDRRLNALVEQAWRLGARFDAWNEWGAPEAWQEALQTVAVPGFASAEALLDAYIYRARGQDEVLPWDHLQSGVEKRFLLHEYRRSLEGELLGDCREGCHACGILQHFADLRTRAWQCPLPERAPAGGPHG